MYVSGVPKTPDDTPRNGAQPKKKLTPTPTAVPQASSTPPPTAPPVPPTVTPAPQPLPGAPDGGRGNETDTEGLRLYPAAATGAYKLHDQQVTGPHATCKDLNKTKGALNIRVSPDGGASGRALEGWGVTVAVIDSGMSELNHNKNKTAWDDGDNQTLFAVEKDRCVIYRDFLSTAKPNNSVDQHGHGTHVITTIADNFTDQPAVEEKKELEVGVAPKVNLLLDRALGADGSGTYSDVIVWVGAQGTPGPGAASQAEVPLNVEEPAPVPSQSVSPVLECVTKNSDGTYTAYFGYNNPSATQATIPHGAGNNFHPSPQDRWQPTIFEPGRQVKVFSVVFDGGALVWTLNVRTSTASNTSTPCS